MRFLRVRVPLCRDGTASLSGLGGETTVARAVLRGEVDSCAVQSLLRTPGRPNASPPALGLGGGIGFPVTGLG